MKVRSPWTIDLLCSSTSSTSISTNAWNLPGTPDVARLAAERRIHSVTPRIRTEKNTVSKLTIEKSMMTFCFADDRCVRW